MIIRLLRLVGGGGGSVGAGVLLVSQVVGAGSFGGGTDGRGDLRPAGPGVARGSNGLGLATQQQTDQLVVSGQGVQRLDDGHGTQCLKDGRDPASITRRAGFRQVVGEPVPGH